MRSDAYGTDVSDIRSDRFQIQKVYAPGYRDEKYALGASVFIDRMGILSGERLYIVSGQQVAAGVDAHRRGYKCGGKRQKATDP